MMAFIQDVIRFYLYFAGFLYTLQLVAVLTAGTWLYIWRNEKRQKGGMMNKKELEEKIVELERRLDDVEVRLGIIETWK